MSPVSIISAVLIFGILIFIHEFGHFLLARKNGIHVIEFAIGMGPTIFSFGKKDTVYSIKLLPFGGYCRMQGFEDEQLDDEAKVELNAAESFQNKSVWSRISVVIAGPVFNFVLAFVFAIIVISVVGYDPARIAVVKENSPAYEAGLRPGDIITKYNGERIYLSREISLIDYINPRESSKPLTIEYLRDGKKYTVTITPKLTTKYAVGMSYTVDDNPADIEIVVENSALANAGIKAGDIVISVDGNEIKSARELSNYIDANPFTDKPLEIGINRNGENLTFTVTPQYSTEYYYFGFSYNVGREKTDVLGVLKYSFHEVRYQIGTVFKSLGLIFKGRVTVDDFSGPVGIADIINETYEGTKSYGMGFVILNMINLTIMLSANLGVMNLLPIPGLDGGRLIFLFIEAIRRKPIDKKKEGIIHVVGMLLIMVFALYILFKDLKGFF